MSPKGPDGLPRRYTTLPGGPVYHSCYENGEELVVNYTDRPYAHRGRAVPPRTHALFR